MAEKRERANMLDEIIANANSHRFEAWTRSWLRGNHDIRMTCIAKNGLTEMLEKEKRTEPLRRKSRNWKSSSNNGSWNRLGSTMRNFDRNW